MVNAKLYVHPKLNYQPLSFRLPKTDEIDMSAIMNDCRKWFLWEWRARRRRTLSDVKSVLDGG